MTTMSRSSAGSWTEFDGELDDRVLIRRSQEGDPEMFGELYNRYVDRIFRYIFFRVADGEMAEDLTSQVFLRAWEKLPSYQAGLSPFGAWLYRIAHNAVVDHYRTRKVYLSLDQARPEVKYPFDIPEGLERRLAFRQIREALHWLTAEQQEVIILRFFNGLNTREIGQQLGKKEGAVRALQMRGLQSLAKYLS